MHDDFKSHSGGILTWGQGAFISSCRKQKINIRSFTEAEVVGVDHFIGMVLWSNIFVNGQGYEISKNILFQDIKFQNS